MAAPIGIPPGYVDTGVSYGDDVLNVKLFQESGRVHALVLSRRRETWVHEDNISLFVIRNPGMSVNSPAPLGQMSLERKLALLSDGWYKIIRCAGQLTIIRTQG